MKKNNKGFTLIELLVVITLILSLLGIAIVSFSNMGNKKKEEAWESVKVQIETVAEQYFKSNEYLYEGLIGDVTGTISVGKLVQEDYLNAVTDPRSGKRVSYCTKVIVKKLANGVFKTSIDDASINLDDKNMNKKECDSDNSTSLSESGGPKISVESSGTSGSNGWFRSNVKITATVQEAGNGDIISLKKCGDDSLCDPDSVGTSLSDKYKDQFNHTKETSGYSYCYIARNKNDRIAKSCISLKIDKTKPKYSIVMSKRNSGRGEPGNFPDGNYENDTWYSGYVKTEVNNVSDEVSGVGEITYTTTGKTTNESNATNSARQIWGEGISYITYKVCDKAGNCASSGKKTVKLDRTAPNFDVGMYKKNNTTDVTSNSGLTEYSNGSWYNKAVFTKAMNRSDSLSGVATTTFTTTGATTIVNNVDGYYRNINAEGVSTITYKVCDKAENCETKERTIKLDRTKPTGTLTLTSTENNYNSNVVNVTIDANDKAGATVSGVKKVDYVDTEKITFDINRSEWSSNSNSITSLNGNVNKLKNRKIFNSLTKSVQTVNAKIVITDNAGNTETVTGSYETYALCTDKISNGSSKGEVTCDSSTGRYTWMETPLYKDKYVSTKSCASGTAQKKEGDSCKRTCPTLLVNDVQLNSSNWYTTTINKISYKEDIGDVIGGYWSWYRDDINLDYVGKYITPSLKGIPEGTYTYHLKGTNDEDCSYTLKYDATPPNCPSIKVFGTEGNNKWYKKGDPIYEYEGISYYFGLRITPSNDTTMWYWYTDNGAGGMNNNGSNSGSKNKYLGEGKRTVQVVPYDNAGNSNDNCTYNYNIDLTPPTWNGKVVYIGTNTNYKGMSIMNFIQHKYSNTNVKLVDDYITVNNYNTSFKLKQDSTGVSYGVYDYKYNFRDSLSGIKSSYIDKESIMSDKGLREITEETGPIACEQSESPCVWKVWPGSCDVAGNCSTSRKAMTFNIDYEK